MAASSTFTVSSDGSGGTDIAAGSDTIDLTATAVKNLAGALSTLAPSYSDTFTVVRNDDSTITISDGVVTLHLTYVGAYGLARDLKVANFPKY